VEELKMKIICDKDITSIGKSIINNLRLDTSTKVKTVTSENNDYIIANRISADSVVLSLNPNFLRKLNYLIDQLYNEQKDDCPIVTISFSDKKIVGFPSNVAYSYFNTNNPLITNIPSTTTMTELDIPSWYHGGTFNIKKGSSDDYQLYIPEIPNPPDDVYHDPDTNSIFWNTNEPLEYRFSGNNNFTPATKDKKITVVGNNYYMRKMSTNYSFASDEVLIPFRVSMSKIKIDYKNEKLIGFDPTKRYTINESTSVEQGNYISINENWIGSTIIIVHLSDDANYSDSAPQRLSIPPKPQPTAEMNNVQQKYNTTNGNYFTGLTSEMEFGILNSGIWKDAEYEEATNLSSGMWAVRMKGTDKQLPSIGYVYMIR
jgi:hypothetical protein